MRRSLLSLPSHHCRVRPTRRNTASSHNVVFKSSELSSRSLERFHTVVCKVCRVVGTTGFAISPKKTTSRFDNHWRNCQLFEVCLNPLKRFLSCKHFCFCFWIELPPFLQCLKQPNLFVMRWFGSHTAANTCSRLLFLSLVGLMQVGRVALQGHHKACIG